MTDGNSLRSKSLVALVWSAIDMGGRQSISFMVSILLARKLAPSDFGLMGIVLFFSNIAQSFVDSGFGPALVQRADITETDKSSVFVFNVTMGAAMTIALFLAAPLIARFYSEPTLVALTRLVSLNLFLGASTAVHGALLTRALDFRTQWKASTIAVLVSGGVAAWMAIRGCGVWALAAQSVVSSVAMALSLWAFSPWRPKATCSVDSLKSFFPFSSRLLLDCLLTNVFDRLQVFVIGRAFSRAQLGYYMRADSTQQTPGNIMTAVCTRVALPTFSAIADDRDRLLRGIRAVLLNAMSVIMPAMIGLAFTSKALVLVLFGEQWLPSVPYLATLSLAGIFVPMQLININVITALGRSQLVVRAGVMKRILIIVAIAVTYKFGLMTMIYGLFVVAMVSYAISAHYCCTLTGHGVRQQAATLMPVLVASAAMSAVLWPINQASAGWPPVIALTAQILTGGVVYAVASRYVNPEATKTVRMLVEVLASRLCPAAVSEMFPPRG